MTQNNEPQVDSVPSGSPRRTGGRLVAATLAVLVAGLVFGCIDRGQIVAEIDLGEPLVERETSLNLEAGRKYVFVQDFEHNNTFTTVGDPPARRYCYRWQLEVEQGGKVQKLSCEALKGRNCVTRIRSSHEDIGQDCPIDDCTITVATSGPAKLRAKLAETQPCDWTNGAPFAAHMKRLKMKITRLSK